MARSLTLLAGPDALAIVRERGLRAEDVDVVPGASGGPKWLVLEALDRFLFGELLQQPRGRPLHLIGSSIRGWRVGGPGPRAPPGRPLHLIGSSIGSWRMACLAQRDPAAAIARLRECYIGQRYARKPRPAEV